jgi:catechol 2,3-dioxygenase
MSTQRLDYTQINPTTDVGNLTLTVTDLGRSVDFYTRLIGLTEIDRDNNNVTLGAPGDQFLTLSEHPGVEQWPRGGHSYAGLYHFAILVPTRADLGLWLQHWLDSGRPLPGQGDHFVSEALYLEDPDGHGIEIYRDRPRDEWDWENGQVRMGVEPVDIQGVLRDADQSGKTWSGMPKGTTLGHIHLQVTDIDETARFYRDVLGFDIVARMPSALFMSAGGYHHHIGANIWHSRGIGQPPDNSVRLQEYTIVLPDQDSLNAVLQRIDYAGIERVGQSVVDPSGISIRLTLAG